MPDESISEIEHCVREVVGALVDDVEKEYRNFVRSMLPSRLAQLFVDAPQYTDAFFQSPLIIRLAERLSFPSASLGHEDLQEAIGMQGNIFQDIMEKIDADITKFKSKLSHSREQIDAVEADLRAWRETVSHELELARAARDGAIFEGEKCSNCSGQSKRTAA